MKVNSISNGVSWIILSARLSKTLWNFFGYIHINTKRLPIPPLPTLSNLLFSYPLLYRI